MGKIKTPLSLIVLFLSGCLSPSRYRAADAFATTPTLPALFRSSCLTSGGGGGGGRWGRNTTPLCMKWDLAGLDWDILWGITSGFCRTDVGKSAFLRSSHFASSPRAVAMWHDAISEIAPLDTDGLPLDGVEDIRDDVHRCAIGGTITCPGLKRVYRTVNALLNVAASLGPSGDFRDCKTAQRMWASSNPPKELVELLQSSFDRSTGELSESAFSSLGPLRQAAAAEMIEGASADAQRRLEEEENRISATFSPCLKRHAAFLTHAVCAAARLDALNARFLLAKKTSGRRVEVHEEGTVDVRGLRHPLLEMRLAGGGVPNSGRLGGVEHATAVVLSGPNGGGKTVFMKAFGLAAALVAHGCFVPCEPGGRVDLFKYIGVTVGDGQDVEQDLSTFSSHMASLSLHSRAANEHGVNTLLLLDELCSGTDPRQGSALAEACLLNLADQGTRIVTTTHYNAVKALPAKDPRFKAASFGLGSDTDVMPTYKARWGVGGNSKAMAAAKRRKLPEGVISRAEELLGREAVLIRLMGEVSSLKADQEASLQGIAALQKRSDDATVRELEMRGRIWKGARTLERMAYQRVHRKLGDALLQAEKVTVKSLKDEEALWGLGAGVGGWEEEQWDYYAGNAEDR